MLGPQLHRHYTAAGQHYSAGPFCVYRRDNRAGTRLRVEVTCSMCLKSVADVIKHCASHSRDKCRTINHRLDYSEFAI
jgi:hypothetical protein